MTLVGSAYLVPGDASAIDPITVLLREEGIESAGNADVYTRVYTHFGVDDARELRERASLGGISQRRVFIIVTPVMTNEAQNALLKTLEESPGDALFFIVVPSPDALLPTVRSRSQVLEVGEAAAASPVDTASFLASKPERRIEMLKTLLEKGDDDRRDVAGMLNFLSALERAVATKDGHASESLHAIYRARKYLGDKGALVKPLLEQVALLVPVMKP